MNDFRYIVIFVLLINISFSQKIPEKCALRIANNEWLSKIEKVKTLNKKLLLIKSKIQTDSIFNDNKQPELGCDYKINFILIGESKKTELALTSTLIDKLNFKQILDIQSFKFPYWNNQIYCTPHDNFPRKIFFKIKVSDKHFNFIKSD